MPMSRASWIVALLALASVVAGSTVSSAQDDPVYTRVMKEKKLRVFAVQFPPQIFQDTPGAEWTGFDADIYRYIAKRLGVEAEFVPTAAAAMISMLTSGRADMGLAMYRTPEREKVIDFTAPSIKHDDPTMLEPNMVFHLTPVLWHARCLVGSSETVRVTETGCEVLTRYPRELILRP